MGVARR